MKKGTSSSGSYDEPLNDDECGDWECDICHDTGFVLTDEDDGEGHTARGVGTRPCLCELDREKHGDDDDDSDEDEWYSGDYDDE